jgi:(hydroxyamino)benzene mutase
MSDALQATLAFTGILLFLFGLLGGAAIPFLKSPRIGLSAHVTALQAGVALVAFAWLGTRLAVPAAWAAPIAHTLWISFYVIWLGLLLGGVWGTGRTLPLAGAGLAAAPWQERSAQILIGGGSIGCTAAVIAFLAVWSWQPA